MDILAYIMIAVALGTVLVVLVLGMLQLGNRDEAARGKSNILMRYRVMTQAVAIGVLFVAFTILAAD